MIKPILCLLFFLVLGCVMLQLRQQRLELNYQTNRLHGQIAREQSRIWEQQLQIARETAPAALAASMRQQDLRLVPRVPVDVSIMPGEPEPAAAKD